MKIPTETSRWREEGYSSEENCRLDKEAFRDVFEKPLTEQLLQIKVESLQDELALQLANMHSLRRSHQVSSLRPYGCWDCNWSELNYKMLNAKT